MTTCCCSCDEKYHNLQFKQIVRYMIASQGWHHYAISPFVRTERERVCRRHFPWTDFFLRGMMRTPYYLTFTLCKLQNIAYYKNDTFYCHAIWSLLWWAKTNQLQTSLFNNQSLGSAWLSHIWLCVYYMVVVSIWKIKSEIGLSQWWVSLALWFWSDYNS
jgi:hypothetical protein